MSAGAEAGAPGRSLSWVCTWEKVTGEQKGWGKVKRGGSSSGEMEWGSNRGRDEWNGLGRGRISGPEPDPAALICVDLPQLFSYHRST